VERLRRLPKMPELRDGDKPTDLAEIEVGDALIVSPPG
jgi:hypothetical protein